MAEGMGGNSPESCGSESGGCGGGEAMSSGEATGAAVVFMAFLKLDKDTRSNFESEIVFKGGPNRFMMEDQPLNLYTLIPVFDLPDICKRQLFSRA